MSNISATSQWFLNLGSWALPASSSCKPIFPLVCWLLNHWTALNLHLGPPLPHAADTLWHVLWSIAHIAVVELCIYIRGCVCVRTVTHGVLLAIRWVQKRIHGRSTVSNTSENRNLCCTVYIFLPHWYCRLTKTRAFYRKSELGKGGNHRKHNTKGICMRGRRSSFMSSSQRETQEEKKHTQCAGIDGVVVARWWSLQWLCCFLTAVWHMQDLVFWHFYTPTRPNQTNQSDSLETWQ